MPSLKFNGPAFWEEKYKRTCCEPYEWICKPAVATHLNYEEMGKVLEIGCGTSDFAVKLRREVEGRSKQVDITCVDFSKELIKKYRKENSSMNYICVDVRNMTDLVEGQFDYIFDKGCIDCLFCIDSFIKEVIKAARECFRLLKPGGKLVVISHGKPKNRVYLFRNRLVPFNIKVEKLGKAKDRPTEVYVYICTKGEGQEAGEEEGKVIIQDEPEEEIKKEQKKGNKKEKKPEESNFILEEPKKKKGEGGDFILGQGKEKKSQGGDFILSQGNEKKAVKPSTPGMFILDEPGQQQEQEEQERQEGQEEQKQAEGERKEEGQKEGEEEQGNFILKQAAYQNDFQQV